MEAISIFLGLGTSKCNSFYLCGGMVLEDIYCMNKFVLAVPRVWSMTCSMDKSEIHYYLPRNDVTLARTINCQYDVASYH